MTLGRFVRNLAKDKSCLARRGLALLGISADKYSARGWEKLSCGDYRGAAEELTKVIELDPGHETAYYNRGVAKHQLEDYQGAVEDYTKAIELYAEDAHAYHNRGVARDKLGDHRGAIHDLTAAIALKPKDANAYFNRGSAKYNLKDYQGAIEDATRAIELDTAAHGAFSTFADAYRLRGQAKSGLGDSKGASEDATKAIELDGAIGRAMEKYARAWKELAEHQMHKAVMGMKQRLDNAGPNITTEQVMELNAELQKLAQFTEMNRRIKVVEDLNALLDKTGLNKMAVEVDMETTTKYIMGGQNNK
jgi:tetratricopeptide (TPR) repeat protein